MAGGGGLQLAVFAGDEVLVHPLPKDGRVTLGRADDNDIQVDNPSVSRRHAVLHMGPPLCVEDLGGANGTFVRDPREPTPAGETANLRQLSKVRLEVAPGDRIVLGTAMIVVRRAPPTQAEEGVEHPGAALAVIRDPAMVALYEQARLAARSSISVLVLGETGVGKEVLARAIHEASGRARGPLLGLNCAALSASLLESELFGHEKGAFTGALSSRPGLFESAAGGTVFLDEIGDVPMAVQVKLLRVLEDRKVLRVGSRSPHEVDVRFVSATNRDLEAECAAGRFRNDLYFRLNGIALTVPPLRERRSEIGPLARSFLPGACRQLDRTSPPTLDTQVTRALELYSWPGNVRELRNVIERAVLLCEGDTVRLEHLPARVAGVVASTATPHEPPAPAPAADARGAPADEALRTLRTQMSDLERRRIVEALDACAGNQTKAARRLGISRRTLVARLGELDLPRPRKKG